MSRHRRGSDVAVILDASNTNPMCKHCDRRTFAVDDTKVACRWCGEVQTVEKRVLTLLRRQLGAQLVFEEV